MPLLPCHIGSSLFVQDVPKLLWQTDIRYISRITEQRSDLPGVPAGVTTTYACDQEQQMRVATGIFNEALDLKTD